MTRCNEHNIRDCGECEEALTNRLQQQLDAIKADVGRVVKTHTRFRGDGLDFAQLERNIATLSKWVDGPDAPLQEQGKGEEDG